MRTLYPPIAKDKKLTNLVAQESEGLSPHSQQLATRPNTQPVEYQISYSLSSA
jgi:hypothetical protein